MMKLKKVLSLILAICMMLTILSGCGDTNDKKQAVADNDEAEVEKIKELVSNEIDGKIEESFSDEVLEELIDDSVESMDDGSFTSKQKKKLKKAVRELYESMISEIDYEIDSVEVDGDTATVVVVAYAPIMDDEYKEFVSNFEQMNFEEILSEEDYENLMDVINKGSKSEITVEGGVLMFEYAVDYIDTEEQEKEIKLEKDGDEWKIVEGLGEESDEESDDEFDIDMNLTELTKDMW